MTARGVAIPAMACGTVLTSAVLAALAWVLIFAGQWGNAMACTGAALLFWLAGATLSIRDRARFVAETRHPGLYRGDNQ